MTTLAACFSQKDVKLDIYNFISLKKNEKPPLSKTLEFFKSPEKKLITGFKKSISMLEDIQDHILNEKFSKEVCLELYSDTKKLSGGTKSLIKAISSFEIENQSTLELIDLLKKTQSILSEIKDILGVYIDVEQSKNDFKSGNVLTHGQVWGTE